MALTPLYPKETLWGVNANEPIYDGYLRVGYWQQTDPIHPSPAALGKSTAVVEFDLGDLPRGQIIDSAILFIDHASGAGTPPDVNVYGTNRKTGNPSDFLGFPLSSFTKLSGPFGNQDIIADVTAFIQSTYNGMGMDRSTPPDLDWMGADFILGSSVEIPGFRSYISGFQNIGGSRPSLWITSHSAPRRCRLMPFLRRGSRCIL